MLDNHQRFGADTVAKSTVQKCVYVQEAVSETKHDIDSLHSQALTLKSQHISELRRPHV